MIEERTRECRACGGHPLRPVLDLGRQPLANAYVRPGDPDPARHPLAVVRCPACTLVQLASIVPPSEMFDDYLYFSSYSDTMAGAMRELAHDMVGRLRLDDHTLVVEVASNDGYLLRNYVELGVPVLGIEPARNVAAEAIALGIPTLVEYFNSDLARSVVAERGHIHLVHANNVLAHVPDINDFVQGLTELIGDVGTVVIETPWVVPLVNKTEFDTIYHEHVFYYSATALVRLFASHGLVISHIQTTPLHGGSLHIEARSSNVADSGTTVQRLLTLESDAGIETDQYYDDFARRVAEMRTALREALIGLKSTGATIAGYGAAAKGTVLLNFCEVDSDVVDFVVDRNPHKVGRIVPGTRIPILETTELTRRRPDYTVILAWNFADEIRAQQRGYLEAGGRFIIPVPELEVVGA